MSSVRPASPLHALILVVILAVNFGCVRMPTPAIYKLVIQQGNVVTDKMLVRLEPDMEKRKVRFLLGTPLIIDTFNEDRWDYIYSYQEGGGERRQSHIVLIFENDQLKRIEGDADYSAIAGKPEPNPEKVISVPDQEPEGLLGDLTGWFSTDETRVPRENPPPEKLDDAGEGFFANIFGGEEASTPTPTVEPEASEATEEKTSTTATSKTLVDYDDDPNTSDTQGDDEDSFFARLKKKFEGLDEADSAKLASEEITSTESEGTGEANQDQGFFERLSDQFGLDDPLDAPEPRN